MSSDHDKRLVRDLAKRYADVCAHEKYDQARRLWTLHNSLVKTRPPIYVRAFAWGELEQSRCECEDPSLRGLEGYLRNQLFRDTFGDDSVLEPWIPVRAAVASPEGGTWGLACGRIPSTEKRGSWKYLPPIKNLDDAAGMVAPHHVIDEEETARRADHAREILGDIVPVEVDRRPLLGTCWNADISTQLAYLRELGQLMLDMMDNPEWLHGVLAFMRDGILRNQQEAEDAGDWRLSSHDNQAMSYCQELPAPRAGSEPVTREKLWVFTAAQELTLVSPAMHEEFMLEYQKPIMEKFGLSSYGCCEDLTNKIDMLRRIRNLRRIAVAPRADVATCAERIGRDYVMSWRPNPADTVSCGFDEERITRLTTHAMEACKGLNVDVTLKDVQTVEGDASRLRRWTELTRRVVDRYDA